jgi:phage terminase large subunit-like protein
MNVLDLQHDPAAFRNALLIDTDQGPRQLSECLEDNPWQRQDFQGLDPGWRRAAGQVVEGSCSQRAWLERPRGHSKSTDIMTMGAWCLFASRRKISGVVAAVDRDQAAIDRDAVSRLLSLNPWLSQFVEVQQWRIVNPHTGSTLEFMASDVASSYGLLIDFAVCDEVTLWPKRELFDSIFSAVAKRSNCLLLCIGNAGFDDSWQAPLRDSIRSDPNWYYHRLDGPMASWISLEILAEQERLLPASAYRRLWLNEWSPGAGDALSPADIAAAFQDHLQPHAGRLPNYDYVGGTDLGVTRDASAICILGIDRGPGQYHGRIRLAATKIWKPTKNKKVDLQEVEDSLVEIHDRFDLKQLNYDPWQATHMASRLQAGGLGSLVRGTNRRVWLPMVEVAPVGANLQRQATVVLEAFSDRRLSLYPDSDLRRDLHRMRVVEKAYGFRLESPRDSEGHGDMGSAFALAMLAASEIAAVPDIRLNGAEFGVHSSGLSDYEQRQREYQEEREALSDSEEDHNEALRHGMWQIGRTDNSPFSY